MAQVDAAGGMYAAVAAGLVQKLIGESARRFLLQVETGERKWSA
jgi:methylmalonyl-CoA mutase N-terminal domain/subunit